MSPEPRSYYGHAVIKTPVWSWEVPCYFFAGGLAGASAGLAYLAGLRGNEELARRAWGVSMAGIAVSPALLISDLGRPMRFANMLRMFKVTSPMSVGSWILSGSGATTTVAAVHAWTGVFPRLARVARPAAAVLGLPLSTYTAALLANTAVPVWHAGRKGLPFVFAAGAAVNAGAASVLVTPPPQARPARRLALGAALLKQLMRLTEEREVGGLGEVYLHGSAHRYRSISRACLAAGAGLLLARGGRSQSAARLAGALLLGSELSSRWSVFHAGLQSTVDPKYVVGPQRDAIDRGKRRGGSRTRARVAAGDPALGSPATTLSG